MTHALNPLKDHNFIGSIPSSNPLGCPLAPIALHSTAGISGEVAVCGTWLWIPQSKLVWNLAAVCHSVCVGKCGPESQV